MSEIVNPKNLTWVSKNKTLALIIVLILSNGYQYVVKTKADEAHAIEVQNWAKELKVQTEKSLEYERQRSQQMEYLLNHLSKDAAK